MQEKFLKETISFVIGKQNEILVEILQKDKFINEFLIAKKLRIEINQTRNLLYRLSEFGIVSSTRKKDAKKGWYTYFWRIEIVKSLEFLRNHLIKRTEDLKNQIKSRETKLFYYCETCHVEHNEENALLTNFVCNECGNVYVLKDNTKAIKDFKKELDYFEKELELLNIEINKEKSKEDHKKGQAIKKVENEKIAERKAKSLKRKKEREKEKRKNQKKPSKESKPKPKKVLHKKSSKKISKSKKR